MIGSGSLIMLFRKITVEASLKHVLEVLRLKLFTVVKIETQFSGRLLWDLFRVVFEREFFFSLALTLTFIKFVAGIQIKI
jgi:hypothetical protein